jgi:phosphoglucosamine mutase
MTRKFFGTDGIRGKANSFPMTAEVALKVAMSTALTLKSDNGGEHQNRAVIGKDTRLSGYMLEQAMATGFETMGMDVIFLGPIPTPALAVLTRSLRADVGVMISASHNSYEDNGIKLFGSDGYKLPDDTEKAIESMMESDLSGHYVSPENLGRASRLDDASGRYVEFIKSSFPTKLNLSNLKIVVDCANGASYKVAPQILWELEAEVVPVGVRPNGRNINENCGATSLDLLQKTVLDEGADIGIALDGDADRLMLVDEKGNIVDGDQIIALLASSWSRSGRLKGSGVVTTVMSNLGLERFLNSMDLNLERTVVGDRYVVERMRQGDFNLGGEQSGHIVLSDLATTGDGLLAAMQVLALFKQQDKPASEFLHMFDTMPQILRNVRFNNGIYPLDDDNVKAAIAKAEEMLANDGRLLVRKSGTEPLIRVMAEGEDSEKIEEIVGDICSVIEKISGN